MYKSLRMTLCSNVRAAGYFRQYKEAQLMIYGQRGKQAPGHNHLNLDQY